MKGKENVFSYLVAMLFSLLIIVLCLVMPYFSSKIVPLIISITMFGLSTVGLVRGIRAGSKPTTVTTTAEAPDEDELENKTVSKEESWRNYGRVGIWVLGFFLGIVLVGFVPAILVFSLLYLKTHGTRWRGAITFSAVITGIIYVAFIRLMNVALYGGLIPGWIFY